MSPSYEQAARDRRARARTVPRRRLRGHRRRAVHRQSALGGQRADHERGHPRPDADRHRDGRRRARARRPVSSRVPPSPPTTWSRWCGPPRRPRAGPGPPRTRSRWSTGVPVVPRLHGRARPRPRSAVFADFAPALGESFARARAGGRELYGFANHELTSTLSRYVDGAAAAPRPAERDAGAERQVPRPYALRLGGPGHAGLQGRRPGRAGRGAGAAAGLGGAPDRAARRAVRDAAAADRRRRSADLPAVVVGGPGRGRGPDGLLQARRRHPGRREALRAAADPAQRPERAGPGVRAVRDRALLRRRRLRLRQRAAAAATDWIRDGELEHLIDHPAQRRADRAAGGAGDRQPDPGRRRRAVAGGDGRGDRARAAADLPLVHPRGRSGDAAADRADPGRRLPGGERRGRRRGEQLPVQRVAGRPAVAGRRRRAAPRRRCRASGATGSPGPRCRRCGSRTSI